MTMREIAIILQELGSEVKYTIRKDGGILITHINGQKFSGAKGNMEARKMIGANISEARVKQLQKIHPPKGGWKKLDIVPEDVKKEIRKMQRQYRKQGVKAGIPTIRKYRANVKLFGKKEANRLLNQAKRYGMGLAYEDNVDYLIQKLKEIQSKKPSDKLREAIDKVKELKPIFKEAWLKSIYSLANTSDFALDVQNGKIQSSELGEKILEIISK